MKYYIEWAATPTNYNPTTIQSVNSLEHVLEITTAHKPAVKFTNVGQIQFHVPHGHVVFKVYRDTDVAREVLYKDGCFGPNHISPTLQGLIKPALPEVLV